MDEIIRGWILQQLGLACRGHAWDDDRGGELIAQLLFSYALLTQEQLDIILDANHPLYTETIGVMRQTIQNLGISMPANGFEDVLEGRACATTKLLYELYLVLNDPNSLGAILPPRLKEPRPDTRFSISSPELIEPPQIEKFSNPLSAALTNKDDVVVYHLDKYRQLMEKCERARQDYVQFVEQRTVKMHAADRMVADEADASGSSFKVGDLPDDAQSLDQSIGELVREQKKVRRMAKLEPNAKVANEIIAGIRAKTAKAQKNKQLRNTCRRAVLIDVWQQMLRDQDDYFKRQFVQMLQQKSAYEQQLTECLLETRRQTDVIVEERRALMGYVQAEKEAQQCDDHLDANVQTKLARAEYYEELKRKNTLHRRMYELKVKRRRDQMRAECASIVDDLLDMAYYTCDFHELHNAPMTRRDQDRLAKRFVAGERIFSDYQLENESETTPADESVSITATTDQQPGAVDELALEDYLQFKWPWNFQPWLQFEHMSDMELGLNVLGHIVHRLLAAKYPREVLPCTSAIAKTAVAACVTGFTDLELVPVLEDMLRPKNIHVFQLKDAFDYCVEVYGQQTNTDSSEDVSQPPTTSSYVTSIEETSPTAILGKQILEQLKMGQNVDAVAKAKAIVAYLRHIGVEEGRGWVLLNYPQTYMQAISLEEAISCARVPNVVENIPEDVVGNLVELDATTMSEDTLASVEAAGKRKSRLLEDPRTRDGDAAAAEYRTLISAFIQMSAIDGDNVDANISDCFKSDANLAELTKFYEEQGCECSLRYTTLDAVTVERLGELILGTKKSIQANMANNDKQTQIPTPQSTSSTLVTEAETSMVEPARPGEYAWRYLDEDASLGGEWANALATLWERVEAVYVSNLRQLCLRRRVLLDALMPYCTFVQQHMLAFIRRPDDKQKHLHDFQTCYNSFDDDMREDDEVKAELQMRIDEFREKLWKMCDARMMESEEERVRVIQENWLSVMLTQLANVFVAFVQLELDRSTDTSQLIADYYATTADDVTLSKVTLPLLQLPGNLEDMDHLAPFIEFVEEHLQRADATLNVETSPFVRRLAGITKTAVTKTQTNQAYCSKVMLRMRGTRGADELETAARGELARINLRLRIIEHALAADVHDVLERAGDNFHRLYDAITVRYRRECAAVSECATLLKRAVEEEVAVQPEMVFVEDMFYVRTGALMYETPLPDAFDLPASSSSDADRFSVAQLLRIADILARLAPSGVIGERPFAFLLQEFFAYEADDGEPHLVPALWRSMEPHKTHALMRRLFGNSEYLDWRDFLVYCLSMRMPAEHEVLRMRRDFRALDPDATETIPSHLLAGVPLWFEADGRLPPSRLRHLRDLLLRLYAFDEQFNYVAMLLAFCKDVDPMMGFVKALAVALGRPICYDEARGRIEYSRALRYIMKRDMMSIVRHIEEKDICLESEETLGRIIDETLSTMPNSDVMDIIGGEPIGSLSAHDLADYLTAPPDERITTADMSDFDTTDEDEQEDEEEEEEEVEEEKAAVGSGTSHSLSMSQGHSSVTGLAYVIDFDVIMNVITATVPWIHKIRRIGELTFHERFALVYNSLINADVRSAFIYMILVHADFIKIFLDIYRFYERDPVQIVKQLANEDEEE